MTLTLEFLVHWLSFHSAHLCYLKKWDEKNPVNVNIPSGDHFETYCMNTQMQIQTHGHTDVTHS